MAAGKRRLPPIHQKAAAVQKGQSAAGVAQYPLVVIVGGVGLQPLGRVGACGEGGGNHKGALLHPGVGVESPQLLGELAGIGPVIGEGVKGAVVQLLLEGVLNQRHALLHLGVVGVLRRAENDFLGLGHVPGPVVQSVGHPQDEKKHHH